MDNLKQDMMKFLNMHPADEECGYMDLFEIATRRTSGQGHDVLRELSVRFAHHMAVRLDAEDKKSNKQIQLGSMVRSYDFPHTDQYFVEGKVVSLDSPEHLPGLRYQVAVYRWHVDGHDAANFTDYVYPLRSGRVEVI